MNTDSQIQEPQRVLAKIDPTKKRKRSNPEEHCPQNDKNQRQSIESSKIKN